MDTSGRSAPPSRPAPSTLAGLVEGYRDPHALYDALREHDRIHYDPAARCWLVTGHAAVRGILADRRFVSDAAQVSPRPVSGRSSFVGDAIQNQIIFLDGPKQERVQRAILVELARRSPELHRPLGASALALAEAARARGEIDLLKDFAVPYSMQAICLILGLPPGDAEEMERLERWTTSFADMTSGYLRVRINDIVQLGEYVRAQVAARGGRPSDDLVGALMCDGGLDDGEDLVIQCMMAFAAGRVTTQKLLGDGIPLLLPRWSEWRALAAGNPSAVRRLTEELLRVVTPTRYVVRYAMEDADLADALPGAPAIRRGEKVVLFLQAANRDPEAFFAPHTLDAGRSANAHLSFGFGGHRCPGASVARIEIQTALQVLLSTLAELRPNPSAPPAWDPNPNLGGYTSYPCHCA
jgi:cytochrome P450